MYDSGFGHILLDISACLQHDILDLGDDRIDIIDYTLPKHHVVQQLIRKGFQFL